MSSTYRLICLSHDPPLVIDEEITAHTPPPGHPDHPNCVLALGRWSGALVEVWMPASVPTPSNAGRWVDTTWMRDHPNMLDWVLRR